MVKLNIDNINKTILDKIVEIITTHKDVEKIVIFGSRADDTYVKTSDIDIAIFSKSWDSRDINIVKGQLEEDIKTPLKFDLLNFYSLSKEGLKKNILSKGKTIYES